MPHGKGRGDKTQRKILAIVIVALLVAVAACFVPFYTVKADVVSGTANAHGLPTWMLCAAGNITVNLDNASFTLGNQTFSCQQINVKMQLTQQGNITTLTAVASMTNVQVNSDGFAMHLTDANADIDITAGQQIITYQVTGSSNLSIASMIQDFFGNLGSLNRT